MLLSWGGNIIFFCLAPTVEPGETWTGGYFVLVQHRSDRREAGERKVVKPFSRTLPLAFAAPQDGLLKAYLHTPVEYRVQG